MRSPCLEVWVRMVSVWSDGRRRSETDSLESRGETVCVHGEEARAECMHQIRDTDCRRD